jgi:hypothetical protein
MQTNDICGSHTCVWAVLLCSLLKVKQLFGGTYYLHLQGQTYAEQEASRATCFVLMSCLACSSTLKMEVTRSSKLLVDFQQTTRHYILEQWYSTWGTHAPGGMRRHLRGT